jgi:plastocyanin
MGKHTVAGPNPNHQTWSRRATAYLLAIALSMCAFDACAVQWFVQSGGSQLAFSPQFLTIQAGDSVTFVNLGGNHNAVADDGSFRCAHGCDNDGHGGNGNASSELWIATVTFPNAGLVGYFCEPHGSPGQGMYGTITVLAPPPPDPAPSGGITAAFALIVALAAAAVYKLRENTLVRRARAAARALTSDRRRD